MPDSWVLVFPGQGAQAVGMARDIADALPEAREMFKAADDILGVNLSRIIFEGPDTELVDTANQQPALVLVGLVIKKALEVKLGRPVTCSAAAGLSLGEYAALCAVEALTFEDALRLVRKRGELMKMAGQLKPSGMSVIMNLPADKVKACCAQAEKETGGIVSPSNYNGGGQIVIGGTLDALAKAGDLCKAAGAKRVLKLPVSGAFHTVLMQPAADQFNTVLDKAAIRRAVEPVYANVTAARVQDADEIRDALKRQITCPVLWEQTIQNLISTGRRQFLELGPGSTVSNMIKRISTEAQCRAVSTWADVQAFAP
ncbi:MAG TPA: ACP S-malonyltransferase [Planctomycetota bacterium]|nr:ACP S-malonyltransferase [Planctomycetota bacterium]